ncbi:MAG TPA: nickel-responsive transcriptional regulator NikR [Nitrospiria bacterium]|jgi:CopG family nickel-responsive transcriptional regulator|nr:nickel-responsive transcriptional regulator NikR [Nitrospiria bacterium]
MKKTIRFGVSLDHHLLEGFDRLIRDKKYVNRSEAIRDLIRDQLVEEEWKFGEKVVGTITIVYDHDVRELGETLAHLQHQYHKAVQSTLHVHLDERNCMEVLVVMGKGAAVRAIADRLIGTKGVKHGKLTMTTTGKALS